MAIVVESEREKTTAAAVSFGFNLVQTGLKLFAAVATGSVSLLSEAVHSCTDVVAATVALVSVRAASAPPDAEHPYGHGKIESLTAFAEAVLLVAVVAFVIVEAVMRLGSHERVAHLDLGMVVLATTSVCGLAVGQYVKSVGRRTQSIALLTNGQHVAIDFWTTASVLAALAVVRLTGWHQADAAFAIGMGLWMLVNAWRIARAAFDQLIDHRLGEDETALIHRIVDSEPDVLSHHRLRTRQSGSVKYVEMHIVVPREWSVVQAHELADRLEKSLAAQLEPAYVVIHVDPYDAKKRAGATTG